MKIRSAEECWEYEAAFHTNYFQMFKIDGEFRCKTASIDYLMKKYGMQFSEAEAYVGKIRHISEGRGLLVDSMV